MIAGVPIEAFGIGAGWAIVAMFVVAILRGALVPRRTYDDKVHEASEWRTESRLKDGQIAEQNKQLGHLEVVGRSVEALLVAYQNAREDKR